MAGRRPKPTILRLLQGNAGKRKINYDEPQPKKRIPEMPIWLKAFPIAISEWNRESQILNEMGIMTEAELGILANRCYIASQIQAIAKEIKKRGRTIKTVLGRKANPLVIQLKNFLTEHRQTGTLLGLDPSSRSRIKVQPRQKESEEDKFLNDGRKRN